MADRLSETQYKNIILGISSINAGVPTEVKVNPVTGAMLTQQTGVSSLVTVPYDTITVLYPSTIVEEYSFRTGGVSGTIVSVVTVTYTTTTKDFISSVVKT